MSKALMILAALALSLGLVACGSDGGDEAADGDDFCGLAENFSSFEESTQEIFTDGGADSEKLEEAWTRISANFASFRDAAPGEIQDDVTTVTDTLDDFTAILEEVDYDITALITKAATDPTITERLEAFEGDEVEAASDRVEEFVREECGVDLS